ncbi:hypothetical protein M407DRAFT_33242 [Tulasnella calospora MUT 4182]|uniref:Uncharacterized protein n=1 Tax=Tulasnella calospora MUT 4182 TaxID=1051891 RepID=A0A0C3L4K1_9AGAM|nr:hypothetical protein M407DRAFT_33818 [Tulasnella calospora MUT 4182]KIO17096.1 hypothetical protein M407DRAFT_33242 [Tulasnella calospora MUT 4182]
MTDYSQPQLTQSNQFFVTERDSKPIYIRVEDTLYCMPYFILANNCDGMEAVLSMGRDSDAANSSANPLEIGQVMARDYEAWLTFRFRSSDIFDMEGDQRLDTLEGILVMGDRFIDSGAVRFAKNQLETEYTAGRCSPARRIHLALRCRPQVGEWLREAITALVSTDPTTLTTTDVSLIDTGSWHPNPQSILLGITQIRHRLMTLRHSIFFHVPPYTHVATCSQQNRPLCNEAWSNVYRTFFLLNLHPTHPRSRSEVVEAMRQSSPPGAMGNCYTRAINQMATTTFLEAEEELVTENVQLLISAIQF